MAGEDDDYIRNMRWLYDDEQSYRKAAARLKLDQLKAEKQTELLKQWRKHRRQVRIDKARLQMDVWLKKAKKWATPLRLKLAGGILAVLLVLGLAARLFNHKSNKINVTQASGNVQLDFKPAVPKTGDIKTVTQQNNGTKLINYQQSYQGTQIYVTEQKLPDSFKGSPESSIRANLSQFENAEKLDTPEGPLLLVSNNTGQQWGVIAYANLLIFFQTNTKLTYSNWLDYINNLVVK